VRWIVLPSCWLLVGILAGCTPEKTPSSPETGPEQKGAPVGQGEPGEEGVTADEVREELDGNERFLTAGLRAREEGLMLIAAKQVCGCSIEGADGIVGTVKDLLFDGRSWTVRYLDVDTGRWLPGRRVIFSPEVIQAADYAARRLVTRLTKEQVEDGPSFHRDLPVSRQREIELARHYSWGAYWANVAFAEGEEEGREEEGNPDLRSTQAVSGYRIQAIDDQIGHVEDFIVDDEALEGGPWEIRYLVIDTRNWLPGRHVLVPPLWAESIDWDMQRVEIGLTREMIECSPEYNPGEPINRQYEEVFYDYYGRPKYWTGAGHAV